MTGSGPRAEILTGPERRRRWSVDRKLAIVAELDRPVNVRDFHVGLLVVFKSKHDHDVYQTAPAHLKFIEENKPTWDKVRVFDSFSNT